MKFKNLIFFIGLLFTISCNDNPTIIYDDNTLYSNKILFNYNFKPITRSINGVDAAELLGNEFIVFGEKGAADGTNMSTVFDNYRVLWSLNSAGSTVTNTHDWEYTGIQLTPPSTLTGIQTIKYWDYNTDIYRFAAYSTGKATLTVNNPNNNEVKVTAINNNLISNAYTLEGNENSLSKCYITDLNIVNKSSYNNVVRMEFRSLSTKIRLGLYETIPGYSVKNVKFYTDNTTTIVEGASSSDAILFGDNIFYNYGKYTIYFPDINSSNLSIANKAHVNMDNTSAVKSNTRNFGELQYNNGYLGTSLNTATYAGSDYITVLPNEEGSNIEMRVDYTLESTDGSGETITIHGAKAFIPAIYTQWLPNYAYTYIFKISDNTNGWTSTDENDTEGLFPITFDAYILNTTIYNQYTATTVSIPSITTYQLNHNPNIDNEYKANENIYIKLLSDGNLITDLNQENKSKLYELNIYKSEADIMHVLNTGIIDDNKIIGRNNIILTEKQLNNTITSIPRKDGNNMSVILGTAASFTPESNKIYAYVYLVNTGTISYYWSSVKYSSAPTDWDETGLYALNPDGSGIPENFVANKVYYKKYFNRNNTYAVKIIKIL